jgi:3-oxoacyl-[acyl-carrier-protein] synthase II
MRDVVITGLGLVSGAGEGVGAHLDALRPGFTPRLDAERFAPYPVHPAVALDLDRQIPKKADQRQMEPWQRLGVYAAGLALDAANAKADAALKNRMHLIVAAGGGERDYAVDGQILTRIRDAQDPGVFLNERLMGDLRPTLFLAQLSNLLAGNISIVHKVTGSSRTFMGEEGSGVSAIDTAAARIRFGQSTHVLVGAATNGEHPEMLLSYELGGYLHRGPWQPLWDRGQADGGGVITGSGAAFLVLEQREHAEKRGVTPYAQLGPVASANTRRDDGLSEGLARLFRSVDPQSRSQLVISGASGAKAPTAAELNALKDIGRPFRAFSNLAGQLREVQLPFAVALAALAIRHGNAYPPFDPAAETAFAGSVDTVLATAVGVDRYEGAALVGAA